MEDKILELIDKYIVYPKETVKELISSSSRVEYATAGTGRDIIVRAVLNCMFQDAKEED